MVDIQHIKGIYNVKILLLNYAIMENDIDAIKALIPHQLNKKDDRGYSPIIIAAIKNRLEIVKLLIESGANIEDLTPAKETPLTVASIFNYKDVVELLIKSGSNVNAADDHDFTALINASFNKNYDVVKLLLDNGAEINHVDCTGSTALIYAVIKHQTKIVKLLLEYGADPNLGKTKALKHAEKEKIKKLLLHYGAIIDQNMTRQKILFNYGFKNKFYHAKSEILNKILFRRINKPRV
jgi:ankyrin repeat protein